MRAIAIRLAWSIGLLVVVVVLNFSLIHLAPGDPAVVIAGESGAGDPAVLEEIREEYGLDRPFAVQLSSYVGKIATGDLGDSFFFNEPVTSLIAPRLWPTILLVGTALIFAIVVGVGVGVFTSRRPESGWSHSATVFALFGFSFPVFFTGLQLALLFSKLGWLPISRMRTSTYDGGWIGAQIDVAQHLILPAFCLGLLFLAQYSRLSRASMLEVLQSDYVRTARAKGLAERIVVYKHALRNAVIPVVTVAGLQFGSLLSGALVVESIFDWPGLGKLAFDSVLRRDANVLLGILLLSATLVIVVNIITDIVYRLVDPRIRIGGSQ